MGLGRRQLMQTHNTHEDISHFSNKYLSLIITSLINLLKNLHRNTTDQWEVYTIIKALLHMPHMATGPMPDFLAT